jgi:secondary thiamine-phosphate synthase enzyme
MAQALFAAESALPGLKAASDLVHLRTERPLQFIDVTEIVAERVRRSEIEHGLVLVQTLHTTAAVLVNEDEPLLIGDLERMLERLAPGDAAYAHDDFSRRAAATEGERTNGHSHAKALLLAPSTTLTVVGGRILLGRWQRIFLVELDGGRARSLSILVLGVPRDEPRWS